MEKKYIPLAEFFQNAEISELTLTYREIETIMGQQLPNAAYLNSSWWKKTKAPFSHFEAWLNAGYFVTKVIIGSEITFSTHTQPDVNASTTSETSIVREMDSNDARPFIQLQQALFAQAAPFHFLEDELNGTVQSIRKNISQNKKLQLGTVFLCIKNGQIIAFSSIQRNTSIYAKHVASIRIASLEDAKQTEIYASLIEASLKWANSKGISRMECSVLTTNTPLIKTLKDATFIQESIRVKSFAAEQNLLDEHLFVNIVS